MPDCKEYKAPKGSTGATSRDGRRRRSATSAAPAGWRVSAIERIHARQILDSRGNPTVEVEIELRSGAHGRAAVPSGASTGEFEATELRDGGEAWGGKGVTRAVANVNGEIARELKGIDAADQEALDRALIELDGTAQQVAPGRQRDPRRVAGRGPRRRPPRRACRCGATSAGRRRAPLPVPMMNVLNGGAHADNKVDFQEFMVVPLGAESFSRVPADGRRGVPRAERHAARPRPVHGGRRRGWLRAGPRLQRGGAGDADRGHRGGRLRAGRGRRDRARPGDQRALLATAPTRSSTRAARSSAGELADYWADLASRYPIVSIEDGMDEEDWDGWKPLTEQLGERVQLVGDDLFVTNTERLRQRDRAGRGQLDPDQGQPDRHAHRDAAGDRDGPRASGYTAVMSHRSGETEDVTIADLAVATGCGQIKTGAPVAHRPRREVQPAAAHRGAARRRGRVPRPRAFPRCCRRRAPGAGRNVSGGHECRAYGLRGLPPRRPARRPAAHARLAPQRAPVRGRRAVPGGGRARALGAARAAGDAVP